MIIKSNIIQNIDFMVNLVIWNEFVHEQEDEHIKSIYPNGIHGCIKEFLSNSYDAKREYDYYSALIKICENEYERDSSKFISEYK